MRKNWNIYGLYIFSFFTYFYLWMPIWVIFLQGKGINLTSIGVLDAVAFVAIALIEIPSGAIADSIGRKYTLALGAFLYAMGMLVIATTESISILVIGYLLWHISNAFFSGTNYAFLYDTLKSLNRESDYQKVAGRLSAISSVALALGSLIGAWLVNYSLVSNFYIVCILSILATLIALSLKEPKLEVEKDEKVSMINILKTSLKFVAKEPLARNLILLNAVNSTVPFIILYVMTQPYVQDKNLPVSILGIIFVGIQLFGSLGSLLSNKLKKIFELKYQLVYSPLLIILILIIIAVAPSTLGLIAYALLSFVIAAFSLSINTKINNVISSNERATILSIGSMISSLLVVLYEPLMLYFYEHVSLMFSMLFSSFIMLITVIPVALLIKKQITSKKQITDVENIPHNNVSEV